FPYRCGAGASLGIDSRRVRLREVTIVNLQFPNFKLGCVSCWNWSTTTVHSRKSHHGEYRAKGAVSHGNVIPGRRRAMASAQEIIVDRGRAQANHTVDVRGSRSTM